MNNSQYYQQFQTMMDCWHDEGNTSKAILNCIVEYLTEDAKWTVNNMSSYDKEQIKRLAERMAVDNG